MKCDNCGRTCNHTRSKEYTRWVLQPSWPPFYREIVQEMWCRACIYSTHPASDRVHWRLRKKLRFADDHPHKPD